MSSNNLFDLTSGVDIFTIDSKVPAGFGIRSLAGADSIVGSDRPDLVYGNDGSDSIDGGIGNDSLQGGRGADLLLGNAGADYLQGERGNDVIYGGEDNDTLIGQEGDDFLAGGAGVDSLIGSDGSDAFVLNVADAVTNPALADTIADFSDEEGDFIALTDGGGDALTEADVTLEVNGADTFIRLKATGAILARVQGASPDSLTGLFSTVKTTLDDTEPGATVLGSIPGGANLQGAVGDEDYADFFQFQVKETSIVNLGLSGLSADADVALYQDLNDDGELGGDEIISASERSGAANETIENVTLDPGKYFLSVEAFEENTNYSLSVAGVAGNVAPDLAGDRPSTARLLPPDAEVELHDYVGGTDAVDTYRLEVLNTGYLDLFTAYQEADLNLTLWSDRNSNNQLDADEIVAQGPNQIQEDNIDPGTYYVNVTAPGVATPYEIAAISEPGSRVDIESYVPLFPGIPTTGTLTQNDDFDPNDLENYADPYLVPELGAGLTVTVTQESQDFDAYLTVVDLLTGEVVAENDDINTNDRDFNARVSFTTEQGGQYVVFASSVDAPGLGDYTLNAAVTGTPIANAVGTASADILVPPPQFLDQGGQSASPSADTLVPPPQFLDQGQPASTSAEIPPPQFVEGKRADTGQENGKVHNLDYRPLAGGVAQPIRISAVNQGQFGDCAFLAALTATFGKIEDPSQADSASSPVLNNLIKSDGNNYTLQFHNYITGVPRMVTVDNQVVTQKDRAQEDKLFGVRWALNPVAPSEASGAPWASIAERAYAKFRGEETRQNGYNAIGNGDISAHVLQRLTGQASENIVWNPFQDEPQYSRSKYSDAKDGSYNSLGNITPNLIFQEIQNTLNQGHYVTATTHANAAKTGSKQVLANFHIYSIHNAYVANDKPMILLRNPWGKDNHDNVVASEDPSKDTQDGFIALTFEEFLKNFVAVSLSKP